VIAKATTMPAATNKSTHRAAVRASSLVTMMLSLPSPRGGSGDRSRACFREIRTNASMHRHDDKTRTCYAELHMFEWDDARSFLAVFRSGSLSAAARQLRVNQSTVGRRVAALEDALGARLFFKTPDGYVLAPAGERLLPHATRMEDEAHALEREVLGQESQLTGSIRITASDAFSVRVVSELLVAFHERYPDIQLELIADNRPLSLTKREADMCLRFGRPKEPLLVTRRLLDFPSAVYASHAYVTRRGKVTDHFAGHDFVMFDEGLNYGPEARWIAQHARDARIVLRSNSTLAQLAAVRGGMGLAVLPTYLGDATPELARVVPPEATYTETLWLVLHRDLQHAARIRACAEFLTAALAERAADLGGGRRAKTRGARGVRDG
jgi:DNA-binding transcriptional LysR family regulator